MSAYLVRGVRPNASVSGRLLADIASFRVSLLVGLGVFTLLLLISALAFATRWPHPQDPKILVGYMVLVGASIVFTIVVFLVTN